jgi:hypothetical protein
MSRVFVPTAGPVAKAATYFVEMIEEAKKELAV